MRPEEKNIVFELKTLDRLMRKSIEAHFRKLDSDDQLTRMHHWIIGFLYDHREKDIYQRDVEAEFKISRSTTSSMLTLMEKKGLIIRQSVPGDARLKKLTLTDKAVNLHLLHMDAIHRADETINGALTQEEKLQMLEYIMKLSAAVRTLNPDSTAEN